MKELEREIVIIGAGPAGLSAAIQARRAGAQVLLVDENRRPGGQLCKQIHKFFGSSGHHAGERGYAIAAALYRQAQELGVEFAMDTVAYGLFKEGVGLVREGENCLVRAKKTIVAAGGSEDPVVFPGSTLPGVMCAGAAQTLANMDRVLPGERIVVLGSGNVGLIVAYQLLQAGAEICAVVEKSDHIGGYGVHAAKLRRAGVPILTGHTVGRALGKDALTAVELVALDEKGAVIPGEEKTFAADTLCLAVGMSPLTELLWHRGAEFEHIPELGGFVPIHDSCMQTTVPGVYAAGDVTGVEEAPLAMEEGILAGVSAAEALGYLAKEQADALRAAAIERIGLLGGMDESGKAAGHRRLAAGECERGSKA